MSGLFAIPPPGDALEQFVAHLTPPGALTWRTLPADLPWTEPPTRWEQHPSKVQIERALGEAGVKKKEARWYIVNGPHTEVMVYSPRELHQKHGRPARAIEVAAERDIVGTPMLDLSARLDLADDERDDFRSARRYLREGRRLLAALGVWPWAHVEDWNRTRRWWQSDEVVHTLVRWHDKAWMDAAHRLAFCARPRNGVTRRGLIAVGEDRACREFRAALLPVHEALREL